jgi:hypothetical protein
MSSVDYNRKIIQIAGISRNLYALTNTGEIWVHVYNEDGMQKQWVKVEPLPADEPKPACNNMKTLFEDIMK